MKKRAGIAFIISLSCLGFLFCPVYHDTHADVSDGLVVYYPFDGTLEDLAGGNDGVKHGGDAVYVQGKQGQAIQLDGVNDYVRCGAVLTSAMRSSISISLWASRMENDINNVGILVSQATSAKWPPYTLYFSPTDTPGNPVNSFAWYLNADGTDSGLYWNNSDNKFSDKERWYHVVVTYDGAGSEVRLYVDGQQEVINPGGGTIPAMLNNDPGDLLIGSFDSAITAYRDNWPFGGKIDEVRIYDRVLTQEEITRLFESTNDLNQGLVAFYPFEQDTQDYSGNQLHGTAHNGPLFQPGAVGNAVYFDGVDDYVQMPGTDDFKAEQFSVAAFVKSNAAVPPGGGKYVFEVGWPGGGHGNGHGMYITNSYQSTNGMTAFYFPQYGSTGSRITTQDTGYQAFKHYCYRYDGSHMKIYVDGELTDSEPVAQIAYSSDPAYFNVVAGESAMHSGGYGINGLVDELRIYNRAITESEIQELASHNTRFNIANVAGGATGLEGTWNINIYDSQGDPVRQLFSHSPDAVTTALPQGNYTYDVFFLFDDGLGVWEQWGDDAFTVSPGITEVDFTRDMPWLYSISPWMPQLSSETSMTVTVGVKNELSGPISVKVQGQISAGNVLSSPAVLINAGATRNIDFTFNDLPGAGVWPLKYWVQAYPPGGSDYVATDHSQIDGYLTMEGEARTGSEYLCMDYQDGGGNLWQLGLDFKDKANAAWFYEPGKTFKNLKFYKNGRRVFPNDHEKQVMLARVSRQFDCMYPTIFIGEIFDSTYGIWRQPCGFSWACGLALTDFDDLERKAIYKDLIWEAITCRNYPYLNTEYTVPDSDAYVASALPLKITALIDEIWKAYSSGIHADIKTLNYMKKIQHIAQFTETNPALKTKIANESKALDKLIVKIKVAGKAGDVLLHTLQNIVLMDFLASSGFAEQRLTTLKHAYAHVKTHISSQVDPVLEQTILELEASLAADLESVGNMVLSSFLEAAFGDLDNPDYVKQKLITLAAHSKLSKKLVASMAKNLKLSKASVATAVMDAVKGLTTVMELSDQWRRIILSGMLSKVTVLYAQNSTDWRASAFPAQGLMTETLLGDHEVRDVFDLQSVFASEYLNRGLDLVKPNWLDVFTDLVDSTLEQAASPPYAYPINYASTAVVYGKQVGLELNNIVYHAQIKAAQEMVLYITDASEKKNVAMNQWAVMFANSTQHIPMGLQQLLLLN